MTIEEKLYNILKFKETAHDYQIQYLVKRIMEAIKEEKEDKWTGTNS